MTNHLIQKETKSHQQHISTVKYVLEGTARDKLDGTGFPDKQQSQLKGQLLPISMQTTWGKKNLRGKRSIEAAYIHDLSLPSMGNEKEQTSWLEIQQQNQCIWYFQTVTRINTSRTCKREGKDGDKP